MHSSPLCPRDLATLPHQPSGAPHPRQHLKHHFRRAALLCSVPRLSPRRGAAARPAPRHTAPAAASPGRDGPS